VEIEIVISGFVEATELLVIPQRGELRFDGIAPRQLRQVPEGQLVLLLHKLFGGRRVGVLQPAIRIGDLDAVVIVHLIAFRGDRVLKRGNGAQK
jgi:hypothetical protein